MTKFMAMAALALISSATMADAQTIAQSDADIRVGPIAFTRSINDAASNSALTDTGVTLTAGAKQDNFRDPNGTVASDAPVLLTRIDNAKPFTFTAQVTPALSDIYDAGALYIWASDDHWLKMAMEMDERRKARIVTVRTSGTSDDNNHDVIAPGSVWMKISSDTRTVGFYYSIDREEWQLVRLYRNEYPSEIWLGISAQSPTGAGTTATFDAMTISEAPVDNFRMGI